MEERRVWETEVSMGEGGENGREVNIGERGEYGRER